MIIDEEIEIDRGIIREKVNAMPSFKDKITLFAFGDISKPEEIDKDIERKIIKLDDQDYKDKWAFIECCFLIKDEDNKTEDSNEES